MTKNTAEWRYTAKHYPWMNKGVLKTTNDNPETDRIRVIDTIDTTTFQTIHGFGALCPDSTFSMLASLSGLQREKVLRELFDKSKTGYSLCGIPLHPLSGETNPNLSPHHNRFSSTSFSILRSLREMHPGLFFWAYPPEPILNVVQRPDAQNLSSPEIQNLFHNAAREFASRIQQYRNEGIPILALYLTDGAVPHATGNAHSLLKNFLREFLFPQFTANNLTVQLWISSHNSHGNEGSLVSDHGNGIPVSGINGVLIDAKHFSSFDELRHRFPNISLTGIEQEAAAKSDPWHYGIQVARRMIDGFSRGMNSYINTSMLFDGSPKHEHEPRSHALMVIDKQNGGAPSLNPHLYYVRHFSYFIKPGACRIQLRGSKKMLAFKNPDGSIAVVGECGGRTVFRVNGQLLIIDMPEGFHSFLFQ